jgi:hypothetical protein
MIKPTQITVVSLNVKVGRAPHHTDIQGFRLLSFSGPAIS